MNRTERRKLRPECRFDNLESRELLNAQFPHHNVAHVSQLTPRVPRMITGTLYGSYSGTTDPLNPNQGTLSYSASGKTSAGQTAEIGTNSWVVAMINTTKYRQTGFNGNETLTFSNGSSIAVSFTYSAVFTAATTGNWKATETGSAVGISGAYWGKTFSFIDKVSGGNDNSLQTEKIRLVS